MLGSLGATVSMAQAARPPNLGGLQGFSGSFGASPQYGYFYPGLVVSKTEFKLKKAWLEDPNGWITAFEAWVAANPEAGPFARADARAYFKRTWATTLRFEGKGAKASTERATAEAIRSGAQSTSTTAYVPTAATSAVDPALLAMLNQPVNPIEEAPSAEIPWTLILGLGGLAALTWYGYTRLEKQR